MHAQVFAQYREQGVLLWRGFTLRQFADQLFGNQLEAGKVWVLTNLLLLTTIRL